MTPDQQEIQVKAKQDRPKPSLIQDKGNQTLRHFTALMKKNGINWRRTWCGSILEIICPALLMLLLVWTRTLLKPQETGNPNMYLLQKPLFSSTTFDKTTKTWQVQPSTTAATNLNNFLSFTSYPSINSTETPAGTYDPQFDQSSPYNFYPKHCVQVQGKAQYSSPIIGYVSTGSQTEKDVVAQLKAIFAQQAQTLQNYKVSPKTSSFPTSYKKFLDEGASASLNFGNFTFKQFSSNDEFNSYVGDLDYGLDSKPAICFGFKITEKTASDIELELMFYDLWPPFYQSIPSQLKEPADPGVSYPDTTSYDLYIKEGYAFMQNLVVNTILKSQTGNPNAQISTMVVPMQSGNNKRDLFQQVIQTLFPLFMILMYIPIMYRMVYRIVYEKVTRAKESMRMMGLGDFAYWFSWLAYYTIVNTVLVLICWAILLVNVYQRKSAFLLFILMWLYGQSLFGLIMIIQSLFQSPRAASIVTSIVYMGTSLFSILVSNDNSTREAKIAVYFFFPTVTMAQCFQPFIAFDATVGATFETWRLITFNTTILTGVIMLIINCINMLLFGTYLELVLPKTYGEQKHPLFFLGFKWSEKKVVNPQIAHNSIDEDQEFETKYLKPEYFEPVGREENLKEQNGELLKISDLKKIYENGFKAVNGVNLKMYADQIFVLLGHNGAGKTSTISMLSGLFTQTEGSAELFGVNMFQDMKKVRQTMGICPQYDVLFELLTTEEHLSFFYDLKGADPKNKSKEIQELMKDVGVYDKRNALASQLSGGNKRKLSVAIALCGGSKFVLLDEPTSGMDLSARRQLWNMLKKQKKDRIILLTTHYMDEADILGDRIAIMAKGKISCVGSSIFLKNKFGVGYNMTIVKSNTEPNQQILPYLQKQLGENVKKQSEIQSEMTLQIPHQYQDKFVSFFKNFDQELQRLQIISYGVSMTTLEEVFLKVGHLDDPKEIVGDLKELLPMYKDADIEIQEKKVDGFNMKDNINELDESFFNNLLAVFYHKFSNYRRNKKALFNEAIIPALIMVFGISISQIQTQAQSPSRIQDPSRLPFMQSLVVNPTPVLDITDANSVKSLINGLPKSQDFNVIYSPQTSNDKNISAFGQFSYNYGTTKCAQPPYMYGSYQIYQVDKVNHQYKFVSFANLTSQDITGLLPEFMYESILKYATNNPKFSFKLRSTPYPPTNFVKVRLANTSAASIVFIGGVAYAMLITSIVSYLVVDRLEGFKHLSVISGMQLKAYWIGNFIFDFAKMYFTIIVTIILFGSYGMGYTGSTIVYLVFPIGILPFTYITSFIFSTDSAAQTFTMFMHFLIYGIGSVIVFFIRFAPTLEKTGDGLDVIVKIIPSYMLGSSVFQDSSGASLAKNRALGIGNGKKLDESIWGRENIPQSIFALILHFIVWTLLLILIEKGYFSWLRSNPDEEISKEATQLDEDVSTEVQRVSQPDNSDMIKVQKFKKVFNQQASMFCWDYQAFVAVSDLSFGLQTGECFALLGVNGAGKSTTFKSLTYEVLPTSGAIKIAGLDLKRDFEKARKLIGYCPQPNLVQETMTVEEHIYYYAMIKGIPASKRQSLVNQAIEQLGLEEHRLKQAGTLSGGNKRKLCVAQALVGNPPIILLDEPSAGMDPEARRFMWNVVGRIAQKKTSAVVLTTHSMDEAEALSTKMGIMVKGGIFKCFGSSQHIKNKFGTGYVLEIKVRTLADNELQQIESKFMNQNQQVSLEGYKFDSSVKDLIMKQIEGLNQNELIRALHGETNLYNSILELANIFNQVELLEKFGNYMKVRVARLDKSIGSVFGILEQLKVSCDVSEYSVGQTTLEQIFQGFADQTFAENVQKFESNQDGSSRILKLLV